MNERSAPDVTQRGGEVDSVPETTSLEPERQVRHQRTLARPDPALGFGRCRGRHRPVGVGFEKRG